MVVSFRHRNAGRYPAPESAISEERRAGGEIRKYRDHVRVDHGSPRETVRHRTCGHQQATYVPHAPDTRGLVLVPFSQAERV
jgi:hypothetical protein